MSDKVSQKFQPGELVNVRLGGVRYVEHQGDGVVIEAANGSLYLLPAGELNLGVVDYVICARLKAQPKDAEATS